MVGVGVGISARITDSAGVLVEVAVGSLAKLNPGIGSKVAVGVIVAVGVMVGVSVSVGVAVAVNVGGL